MMQDNTQDKTEALKDLMGLLKLTSSMSAATRNETNLCSFVQDLFNISSENGRFGSAMGRLLCKNFSPFVLSQILGQITTHFMLQARAKDFTLTPPVDDINNLMREVSDPAVEFVKEQVDNLKTLAPNQRSAKGVTKLMVDDDCISLLVVLSLLPMLGKVLSDPIFHTTIKGVFEGVAETGETGIKTK